LIELVLRIGFSLLVVMGLMWALARAVRRPLGVGRPHGQLAVLNRQQLTRGAALHVVKVADRAMILGVTDTQVSLLGEADIADFEKHPAEHRDHVQLEGELPDAHPEAGPHRLDHVFRHPLSTTIDFLRDRTSRR
jgi:flagellar protein FliO/FliZ